MSLEPDQITIAVTVYSRRQYVSQAVASALEQTVPVKVIVVEDCGPDATLQPFVEQQFGSRIGYLRNPRRRGLFGNWNACIEYCRTPWLSILHDDDYLTPVFVEAMLELYRQVPELGLYFGHTRVIDQSGQPLPALTCPPVPEPWKRIGLKDAVLLTPFPFPGQLFRVDQARAVGGFRETSQYCGDWEMWCKLMDRYGAVESPRTVAVQRQHRGWDRGTNRITRTGRQYPLSYVQHKRVLALLRQRDERLPFDRRLYQRVYPVPTRYLLRYGATLHRRMLIYHVRLLLLSTPPHRLYALFQLATRLLGWRFVRLASYLWRLRGPRESPGPNTP